jgi:hypothetical protein
MDKIQQQFKKFLLERHIKEVAGIEPTPSEFSTSFLEFLKTNKVPCFECGKFYGYKSGYRMGYFMCLNKRKQHKVSKYLMIDFIQNTKEFLLLISPTQNNKKYLKV